jgi:PAS domain-containing protein
MRQLPIELILTREFASHLASPVFVVDAAGALLFYNEPAERLLGSRYEETGAMPAEDWTNRFASTDAAGERIPPDELPLAVALREARPVHGSMWVPTGRRAFRRLEVTALSLCDAFGATTGAVAFFWEADA